MFYVFKCQNQTTDFGSSYKSKQESKFFTKQAKKQSYYLVKLLQLYVSCRVKITKLKTIKQKSPYIPN